jgi:hypothetical protein
VDLGFVNNRIIFGFDYYQKLTSDMLLDVPLPTSTTTGSVRLNYGKIQNEGVEATVSTHNIKKILIGFQILISPIMRIKFCS